MDPHQDTWYLLPTVGHSHHLATLNFTSHSHVRLKFSGAPTILAIPEYLKWYTPKYAVNVSKHYEIPSSARY